MSPVDPNIPRPLDPAARMAERIATLERELAKVQSLLNGGSVQQVPVVASLPAFGREGRLVRLRGAGLYQDTGTAWVVI